LDAQKIFVADLSKLHAILQWIRSWLVQYVREEALLRKLELVSEEALVNIISHAYKEEKGTIHVSLVSSPSRLEIILRDQGPPFNPLEFQAPHIHRPLEERPEGGLGILFIKHFVDEVHYERTGNANVLTLVKFL
jgi:anti-sigma regulatory factor (Ser/Thr protein kinase)